MNPNTSAESAIIAQSVATESMSKPTGLTPDQERLWDAGARFSAKYQATKDTDPLAALKEIEKPKEFEDADIERAMLTRIGTDVTPALDDRGNFTKTEQGQRLQQAAEAAKIAKGFTEKGYDALIPTVKDKVRDDFIKEVLDRRPAFANLSIDQKKAMAEAKLRDPEYQVKLAELLDGKINIDLDPKLAKDLEETTVKKAEADRLLTEQKAKMKSTQEAIRRNKAELDRFSARQEKRLPNGTVVEGPGDKYMELQDRMELEAGERLDVDKEIKFLKDQGLDDDAIKTLRKDVKEKVNNGTFDYAKATETERVAASLIEHEDDLDKLEDLKQEQVDLAAHDTRLVKDLQELKTQYDELYKNAKVANDALDNAYNAKEKQEEEYVRGLQNLFNDTGRGMMSEEVRQRGESYKKWLDEQVKNAKDGDSKKVATALETLCRTGERKGKETIFKIDRKKLQNNWEIIFKGAGPESILRNTLMNGLEPNPLDTPEEADRKDRERTRIEERLKNDKDFVKDQCVLISGNIISEKMKSKGLYEGEVEMLLRKPWGESAIDVAIASDKRLRDKLDKIYQVPGAKPGYVDRIRRESGSSWVKFLALFLTGAVAAGLWTGRYAAQEGGRGFMQ